MKRRKRSIVARKASRNRAELAVGRPGRQLVRDLDAIAEKMISDLVDCLRPIFEVLAKAFQGIDWEQLQVKIAEAKAKEEK